MDARVNRWTGEPHAHARERARHARQKRAIFMREFEAATIAFLDGAAIFGDYGVAAGLAYGSVMADTGDETPLIGGSHLVE